MANDDPIFTTKGQFIANSSAVFFFSFPNLAGDLFDPSDINTVIYDPDGVEIAAAETIEKIETGQYAVEWVVPAAAVSGRYSITITFIEETVDGPEERTFTEHFIVVDALSSYVAQVQLATRAFLETFMGYAQRVPVFNEIGRLNKTRTQARFTFPRWNQTSGVRIYVNGEVADVDREIDYTRGRIDFSTSFSRYDQITADYTFRWFSDDELDGFITEAINLFNQYPPHSAYDILTLDSRYGITVMDQAAVFCLRRMIMDLMFQEPIKVYGGADRADAVQRQLESLKQNYEKELESLYEQKKYQPYLGLTKTIVTPEYTLPGGRSRWFRYLFKGA